MRGVLSNKKGVSITINTVVLLSLALIVLIVLSMIFLTNAGKFNKETCLNYEKSTKCPFSNDCKIFERGTKDFESCVKECAEKSCES
jgi:hypothetical protein